MAKFASASILDGGPDLFRTRAATVSRVRQQIIKAYTAGDSYATVQSNLCATVDLVSADFTTAPSGLNRVTTVAAKSGVSITAGSGASPNLHIAIVDSVSSEVLYVTDETTDQVLTAGNQANIPAWTITISQPT